MPSTMSSEVSMPRASSIVMTPSLPTLSIASAMIRPIASSWRSEEHTSELQSPCNLVCRLLLEKKKRKCHKHPLRSHRQRLVFILICLRHVIGLIYQRNQAVIAIDNRCSRANRDGDDIGCDLR